MAHPEAAAVFGVGARGDTMKVRKTLTGPSPQQATALAYLAIHECRRAAVDDPNDPVIYRTLSSAYSMLQQIEQRTVAPSTRPYPASTGRS
jgi:hypothetical protein